MPRSAALSLYLLARRSDRDAEAATPWPPRPEGELVWLHTGRAAPTPAVRELARRLVRARPGLSVVMTRSAADGEGVMDLDAPGPAGESGRILRLAAPAERTGAIDRFLAHWRPVVAVWTEHELRPALIERTAEAGVPMILVDAATARPAGGSMRWRPRMTRALLHRFTHVMAADDEVAAELRRMGLPSDRLEVSGPLREAASAPPCNEAELADLAAMVTGRQVWLALEVGAEEAEVAVAAHQRLLAHAHRLLLIVRPRLPREAPALARRWRDEGWQVGVRSDGDDPRPDVQVYLADLEGEDGIWLRLAPVCFLGGALPGGAGVDPLPAAALGSAILHGPHVSAHADAYELLHRARAAQMVRSVSELHVEVEALLSPELAARRAAAAWDAVSAGAEVTDRALDLILTLASGRAG